MNELKEPVLWSGTIAVYDDYEYVCPHLSESQPQWVELPDPYPPAELVPAGTTEKLIQALETMLDNYEREFLCLDYMEDSQREDFEKAKQLLAALRGESEAKNE